MNVDFDFLFYGVWSDLGFDVCGLGLGWSDYRWVGWCDMVAGFFGCGFWCWDFGGISCGLPVYVDFELLAF